MPFLAAMVINLFIAGVMYMVSRALSPKPGKPDRSTLDTIQIPTQGEGQPFSVIFGTPARISHTHVLYYGFLELQEQIYKEQTVGYYHILTVHLGLCRSGIDGVQQLWYKDTPVWPVVRDETAVAADGTTSAYIEAFEVFGGWRRDGGIQGTVDILYGAAGQAENTYLRTGQVSVSGVGAIIFNLVYFKVISPIFAAQPDGYWVGGQFTYQGRTVGITYHVGSEIRLNSGELLWVISSTSFTATPPAAVWPHGPAYRGITSLVFRHAYWGITPVLGTISHVSKRTLHLTDGSDQWYVAKAVIGQDLNPAHVLRECFTDTTWGEALGSAALGTTWAAVADTLYAEGFGLSFNYVPEPGALQDFVDMVLEHIDGYIWQDRSTGLIEISLARDDYEIADLDTYDQSDFTIVDWQTPTWRDVPGRVVLQYSNRLWPDNAKTSPPYDDIAVQAKQQGRINEQVVSRPGVFDDDLAALIVNRLGRAMCRLLSIGTLRAKRTMSDLHKGSVFVLAYDDPHLAITQMVVRVANIKYGKLGADTVEIDVVEDVWSSAYTIYGLPETPIWQPPPIEPIEYRIEKDEVVGVPVLTGSWTDPSA